MPEDPSKWHNYSHWDNPVESIFYFAPKNQVIQIQSGIREMGHEILFQTYRRIVRPFLFFA
jgi:hypothetical protein